MTVTCAFFAPHSGSLLCVWQDNWKQLMVFVCAYVLGQVLPMRRWCKSLRDTGTDWNRMHRDRRWGRTTTLCCLTNAHLWWESCLFIWLLLPQIWFYVSFVDSSLVSLSFFTCHLQPMLGPHQPSGSSSNSSAVVSGGGDGGLGGGSTGGGGLVGCGRGRGLNLKMKFVCGQCWREGQVNEPDKSLKYCTAKARHRLASLIQAGIILPPGCTLCAH